MNIHIKSVFENVIVDDKNKQIEEKDKYIKALKEDIETFRIQSNYFIDRSDDLEKEVDRLKAQVELLEDSRKHLIKITDELENDLKKNLQDCRRRKQAKNYAKSIYAHIQEDVYDYILFKLKELKEGK